MRTDGTYLQLVVPNRSLRDDDMDGWVDHDQHWDDADDPGVNTVCPSPLSHSAVPEETKTMLRI